jgi:hypothetical protein
VAHEYDESIKTEVIQIDRQSKKSCKLPFSTLTFCWYWLHFAHKSARYQNLVNIADLRHTKIKLN